MMMVAVCYIELKIKDLLIWNIFKKKPFLQTSASIWLINLPAVERACRLNVFPFPIFLEKLANQEK